MGIPVKTETQLARGLRSPERFDWVRTQSCRMGCASCGPWELMDTTDVWCMKDGRSIPATDCISCSRFVDFVPPVKGNLATLRCQWRSTDRVEDIRGLSADLATVTPELTVQEADAFAQSRGVRHLLVVANGELQGLLCRCDLVELPGRSETERVVERMSRSIFATTLSTSLADAASLMADNCVGCLPIVHEGSVVGLLTRGDLRRLGMPERFLGTTCCAACGSVHGVRPDPRRGVVEYCLACLEGLAEPIDYEELGCGD